MLIHEGFQTRPSRTPRSRVHPTRPQRGRAVIPQYGFRYLIPVTGRWAGRDPIGEVGGINPYELASADPLSNLDATGLTSAKYDFDKTDCHLFVRMTWKLNFVRRKFLGIFPTSPSWTDVEKQNWKDAAWLWVTAYFASQQMRCYPSAKKCCLCAGTGVRALFDLRFVENGPADVVVDVTTADKVDAGFRPSAELGGDQAELGTKSVHPQSFDATLAEAKGISPPTTPSKWQVQAVHELGHLMGLSHPGNDLPDGHRPKPDSLEDYYADPDSLMGVGMTLRKSDFQKGICDHIVVPEDKTCDRWSAR